MRRIDSKIAVGFIVFSLCLFAGGALAGQYTADGEKNEVFALGKSPVVKGNQAAAKKKAVSRALHIGLENYLTRTMGKRHMVANFQRIAGNVLSRGVGPCIENYNILAEELDGENYWVFVRVKINETILKKRLRSAGVVKVQERPVKVLFMLAEKRRHKNSFWWGDPYGTSPMSTTELAFYNVFRQKGFSVVNRTRSIPGKETMKSFTKLALKNREVCRWGRIFSADVVLYGSVGILLGEKVSFNINAFSVGNCKNIYNESGSVPAGKGPDTENSILVCVEKLAEDLIDKYASVMVRGASKGRNRVIETVLVLKGLNSFSEYKLFRDFLENDVKGVISVLQRRVRAGTVSIAVQFRGDNRHVLLDRILGHKDIPFEVSVEDISEREIKLNIEDNSGDIR